MDMNGNKGIKVTSHRKRSGGYSVCFLHEDRELVSIHQTLSCLSNELVCLFWSQICPQNLQSCGDCLPPCLNIISLFSYICLLADSPLAIFLQSYSLQSPTVIFWCFLLFYFFHTSSTFIPEGHTQTSSHLGSYFWLSWLSTEQTSTFPTECKMTSLDEGWLLYLWFPRSKWCRD